MSEMKDKIIEILVEVDNLNTELASLKKQIEEQKPKAKPDLREELIKFWETCEIARQTKEKVVDDYLNQTNKP